MIGLFRFWGEGQTHRYDFAQQKLILALVLAGDSSD